MTGVKILTKMKIECGFVERLRILFGAPIRAWVITETEHDPGQVRSDEAMIMIQRDVTRDADAESFDMIRERAG